ncbi:MAG TPA: hypothetical protein VGX97_02820 [bacterium]|nr:hypothetical protein [bacterium]
MIRRLTIACGLLTLAVVVALALQDHSLFGARSVHPGAAVTAIPDKAPAKPAPPLRGLPPAPRPQPLHHAPAATRSPVQQVMGIVHTLLNLPKAIGDDQTEVNPGH